MLGSLKCDCAEQLALALEQINNNPPGMVIYLQQEGRGIGLANKIAAYSLQVGCSLCSSIHPSRVHATHRHQRLSLSPTGLVSCVSQEQGLDTVDANRALGLPDDCREYTSVRNIIQNLGIKSIKLMVRLMVASFFRRL